MSLLFRKVKKAFVLWKAEGFKVVFIRTANFFRNKYYGHISYKKWIRKYEMDIDITQQLPYVPLISIIVPVYNVKIKILKKCIESVINQTASNWELCLVDDCSTLSEDRELLKFYEKQPKVKVIYRTSNGHICCATNDAIQLAEGDFIGFLDCDDLLSLNAVYEITKMLNKNPGYDFIYSDEDLITENGRKRYAPIFKPDWSPDTFMSMMYTCHFAVYRKKMVDELGGLRVGFEGAQDYDFTLRFVEKTNRIGHIPKILYHWRARKESTAYNPQIKQYAFEAMRRAKKEALVRRGLNAKVIWMEKLLQYRIEYIDHTKPLISIIIPSKNNFEFLKRCINSIRQSSTDSNYEIIIVDNGSCERQKKEYAMYLNEVDGKYIYETGEFNFSYMCNIGSKAASGEYLLFLNDDMEVITDGFLQKMEGHASLRHIGAVGAKLLYPHSDKIQHCGIINYEIGPGHCLIGMSDSNIYYAARNAVEYNCIAVTGACLMVSRKKFEEIGKYNEDLPIAYNDVDLCFRLLKKGYYNVIRNDVKLYHYESVSRGYDEENFVKRERQLKEMKKLYEIHPDFKGKDPFYNPNLTTNRGDFSLR